MQYKITKPDHGLKGKITLPGSKSISNRLLIIRALCETPFRIDNLSTASDTIILQQLLTDYKNKKELHAGEGGTSFRFLLAFLAVQKGEWVLHAGKSLQKRPIEPLVDALRSLGAEIEYTEKKGFPPLQIKGGDIKGKRIKVDGSISSQFISALLLIAPLVPGGIKIDIKNKPVSGSYIRMTAELMDEHGIITSFHGNSIHIEQQKYKSKHQFVEGDWSSASYFYEMAALADEVDLYIYHLHKNSKQGDSVIEKIMDDLGVETRHHLNEDYSETGVHLVKHSRKSNHFSYDFNNCPDLVPSVAVTTASLGMPASFTNIDHLRFKESDRIKVLQDELNELGSAFVRKNGQWRLQGVINERKKHLVVDTQNDHRIAMSFAPLAFLLKDVFIKDPEVVNKSYPEYWEHLKSLGFEVRED